MLVSVIVPVYNAAQFLEECIQSILKQDFEDFELILINDGSTDNSGEICNQYTSIDERVKVFHKENGGVSSARNLGIEKAKGKWITFIDSDDTIQENYFLSIINENSVELVMVGFNYLDQGKKVKGLYYSNQIYSKNQLINNYRLYPDFSSSCAKFYLRFIIIDQNIKFSEKLTYGEDSLFTLSYLWLCQSIKTSNLSHYNYRLSTEGLTNTKINFSHDKLLYENLKTQLKKFGNDDFINDSIIIPLTRYLISLYNEKNLKIAQRRQILKMEFESNYSQIFKIYTNPKLRVFIKIAHLTGNYILLDKILYKLNKR